MLDSTKRLIRWFTDSPEGRGFAIAGIVVLVLCQQLFTVGSLAGHHALSSAVNDSLHIPLFAVLALLFTRALRYPPWPVLLAVCATAAAATEVLQLFTGRDASVMDAVRDVVGALPAIGLIEVTRHLVPRRDIRSLVGVWVGTLVLLVSLTLAGPVHALLAHNGVRLPDGGGSKFEPAGLKSRSEGQR